MFTLLKHVISVVIWAVVAAAFLIAKSPELFAFWVLVGAVLILAWIVKFIWKWIVGIFLPTVSARGYFIFIVIVLCLGLGFYQIAVVPVFNSWGATTDELKEEYPIDEFIKNGNTVAYRAITVDAPVDEVYPLVNKLATSGVLNFDVNLLDLLKNNPARMFLQDVPTVSIGDRYLIGEVVQVQPNKGITLELNRQRFPWNKFNKIYAGYYLQPVNKNQTRIVMKIKADYSGFLAWFSAKYLIELGDYWVSSYQLTSIKHIAENKAS
jgi:hypothetical protein